MSTNLRSPVGQLPGQRAHNRPPGNDHRIGAGFAQLRSPMG